MSKALVNTTPAAPGRNGPSPYVSRDEILSQLSFADAAVVRAAEAAASVGMGEEYLDLHHLDRGVRQANGTAAQLGNVLPRRAVGEQLWTRILAQTP
ncbi:MAG: hypothetical protein OEZ06_00580 [Myxococcales bacterium]|nr:hypothetical protein [Myxococcales bacterium]